MKNRKDISNKPTTAAGSSADMGTEEAVKQRVVRTTEGEDSPQTNMISDEQENFSLFNEKWERGVKNRVRTDTVKPFSTSAEQSKSGIKKRSLSGVSRNSRHMSSENVDTDGTLPTDMKTKSKQSQDTRTNTSYSQSMKSNTSESPIQGNRDEKPYTYYALGWKMSQSRIPVLQGGSIVSEGVETSDSISQSNETEHTSPEMRETESSHNVDGQKGNQGVKIVRKSEEKVPRRRRAGLLSRVRSRLSQVTQPDVWETERNIEEQATISAHLEDTNVTENERMTAELPINVPGIRSEIDETERKTAIPSASVNVGEPGILSTTDEEESETLSIKDVSLSEQVSVSDVVESEKFRTFVKDALASETFSTPRVIANGAESETGGTEPHEGKTKTTIG